MEIQKTSEYPLIKPGHFSMEGFPWEGGVVKNPPANPGDTGLISRSGRSLGGGNGNPLQYSCLENSMDRGAWWAPVHGVSQNRI